MKKVIFLLAITLIITACKNDSKTDENLNKKLNVVTTTTMITDLVKNIGGDSINVQGLMGAGVDPHLYKASEGDVSKLVNADVIFYNGLHLEGKLVEVFEKMKGADQTPIALGDELNKNQLIGSDYFASNYDPHVWFNIDFFEKFVEKVTLVLCEKDPKNTETFRANEKRYLEELEDLKEDVQGVVAALEPEKRVLVTAHDAFNYFGKAYDFNVVGLQGLSTATEAGVKDVQKLAAFIIEKNIKAIFIESSVPKRTIEALQQAVKSKGHDVAIGGTLYSDALGSAGSREATYIGMYRYNIKTIVGALNK